MKLSIEDIKKAIQAGYSAYIVINGEYYEIDLQDIEKGVKNEK